MIHKKPSEVFTPRAAQVNESMYIARSHLEERLIDSLDSNKYIVIHGESGNGKTWLYKRVFIEQDVHYDVVNLSQVAVAGSLESVFAQKLGELQHREKTKVETTAVVGARPFGTGAEYQTKTSDEYAHRSPFHTLLGRVCI